ncbi:hypothetical protein A3J90_03400 [candidate division WOR-1 bacterium RIFOXYC2_FULL_37_10]|uniref:1-acyl-sn-glycerol-3-phosphate acyltransferase n=1 Tax=candidate division WOR-1 bacterium RIFOXYB2_FULL_37_13 TaxID=1802579 RepID=A0A1F4SVF4_UNCSA|nr:MAG: hypothetical protein A2246_01040 [candidate division WOR-1 bacterium RIFOXYA2_FULL_37_7]OGC24418.1 MAG: hypothetical protein A2310_08415 [candidate division WOR-1 bacterium RIFOXYB2_FULL_37_13]OGC37486.1 MAG: hypothetical protein A3J90_03400 [candidate division WOR-1 bacterium RIFOXYC2_FULL_37_10]
MNLIRTVLLCLVALITFFIGSILTILISFFYFPKDKVFIFQRAAIVWARLLVWISGIPINVYGRENIPLNEPLILVSNHQGMADILIALAILPVRFRFIIKKELFSVPIFGWYLRKSGYIPVDRGTRKGALDMFVLSKEVLEKGESILIFPEGTRSPDGKLQEFKRGSMFLAIKNKVRVLPLAISGSFGIMPKKSYIIHSVPVQIKIGKPVSLKQYGKDSDKANEEVYRIIKEML